MRKLAKPYLQICAKLAKACEITFANPCETEVFLRMHICETLRKYMHFALANPCETLRKHDKGVFIDSPTPAPGPPQNPPPELGPPQRLHTLR